MNYPGSPAAIGIQYPLSAAFARMLCEWKYGSDQIISDTVIGCKYSIKIQNCKIPGIFRDHAPRGQDIAYLR